MKLLVVPLALLLVISSAAIGWAEPEEVIELRIAYHGAHYRLVEPAVEKFEAAHPWIDVILEPIPKLVDMKITWSLAAGVPADVIWADSYLIADYVEAGFLLPLDEYVAVWPGWEHFYGPMKEIGSYEGVVYGTVIGTDVRGIWQWLPNMKKAGIPLPWQPTTWDDIFAAAEKLEAAGVEIPLLLQLGSGWGEGSTMQTFYMLTLGATTPVMMDPESRLRDWQAGKWIGKSPAYLHAFEFIERVLEEGWTPPEMLIGEVWAMAREAMREGRVGLYIVGQWEWAEFWPAEIRPPVEERWELLGFAKMPGREEGFVTISGGWTMAIPAVSEHPDLAWKLIETILELEHHAEWLVGAGKIAPRADVLEVPEYAADEFLMMVTPWLEFSTFRDTYPTYSKVSALNQAAIDKLIAAEVYAAGAMYSFHDELVAAFGADEVTIIE